VPGVITEDRGEIGYRGRRLYQVRLYMDPDESSTTELGEDEIEPVDEVAERSTVLDKAKVKRYLIHGGLIAILRSNLDGDSGQRRVWLRPDSLGNITHTFAKDRGFVGGETVPDMAWRGEKIFSPKRGEVLSLLESFDLDRADAEKVLASVGTAP
jgi:hypothetical protein